MHCHRMNATISPHACAANQSDPDARPECVGCHQDDKAQAAPRRVNRDPIPAFMVHPKRQRVPIVKQYYCLNCGFHVNGQQRYCYPCRMARHLPDGERQQTLAAIKARTVDGVRVPSPKKEKAVKLVRCPRCGKEHKRHTKGGYCGCQERGESIGEKIRRTRWGMKVRERRGWHEEARA
jgi:ribosomal protein L32